VVVSVVLVNFMCRKTARLQGTEAVPRRKERKKKERKKEEF